MLSPHDSKYFCCKNGAVKSPFEQLPEDLEHLYAEKGFSKCTRQINNSLAFAGSGVTYSLFGYKSDKAHFSSIAG